MENEYEKVVELECIYKMMYHLCHYRLEITTQEVVMWISLGTGTHHRYIAAHSISNDPGELKKIETIQFLCQLKFY